MRNKRNPNKQRVRSLSKKMNIVNYCAQIFPSLSNKTAAKEAIEAGQISLNEQPATISDLVKNGDFIHFRKGKDSIRVRDNSRTKAVKLDIELPIIFEDDHLIIINKPGGIAVNGNRNKTVENAVRALAEKSNELDALENPIPVHRLDVPTKGLVMLAKTRTALVRLNKAFQEGKVNKVYYAITHGETPKEGQIDVPIDGKESLTEFEQIQVAPSRIFNHFSLLKLKLITGRTHQLRIHLNDLGHLIVGDKQYAKGQKTILGKGLFLCACQLNFKHPISQKTMNIEIPIPNRFKRLMEKEKKRYS